MIHVLEKPQKTLVSLPEVRAYLKIPHRAEDMVLEELLWTAEARVGEQRGHYGLTQRLRVTGGMMYRPRHQGRLSRNPAFRHPMVSLPVHPIQEVERVQIITLDGRHRVLTSKQWHLSHYNFPGALLLRVFEGVVAEVDLRVGYGDSKSDVPPILCHQVLRMVSDLYHHREQGEFDKSAFPRRLGLA